MMQSGNSSVDDNGHTNSFVAERVDQHDAFWGHAPRSNAPRIILAVFVTVLLAAVGAVAIGTAQIISSDSSQYVPVRTTVVTPPQPIEVSTTTVVPRPGEISVVDAATLAAAFADRLYTSLITPSDVGAVSTEPTGNNGTPNAGDGDVSRDEQRIRDRNLLHDAVTRWALLVTPVAALHPAAAVTLDGVGIAKFPTDAKRVVFGEVLTLVVRTDTQVCTVEVAVPGSAAGTAGPAPAPVCD